MFTKTTNLTQRTQNLSPQRQYPTSRALLRLSHRSYNLTTSVSLTNRLQLYGNFKDVKDKDEPNDRQGAVYQIKCRDCQASYIGETDRNLNIRLTEHKQATKNEKW